MLSAFLSCYSHWCLKINVVHDTQSTYLSLSLSTKVLFLFPSFLLYRFFRLASQNKLYSLRRVLAAFLFLLMYFLAFSIIIVELISLLDEQWPSIPLANVLYLLLLFFLIVWNCGRLALYFKYSKKINIFFTFVTNFKKMKKEEKLKIYIVRKKSALFMCFSFAMCN